MPAFRSKLAAAIGLLMLTLTACSAPAVQRLAYEPKGPVDTKYQASGPWAVATMTTEEPCDREGNRCTIWYPARLGTNAPAGGRTGFRHPVIAWANGSGQAPERYEYLLRHFASWGFVVVASRDEGTGDGSTTLDAADFMRKQDAAARSRFFGKLDLRNMGAAGHSQGGASVIALFARGDTPFNAFATFHAAPSFFAGLCCGVRTSSLAASQAKGAILHMGGAADPPDVQMGWYDATPAASPKALGILSSSGHDDVMGNPACREGSKCVTGADGYIGYSTAWFMGRLQAAPDAKSAFRANGEFAGANPHWTRTSTNIP